MSWRRLASFAAATLVAACGSGGGDRPLALRESVTPLAYDSTRGRTVLFGRFDGPRDETWEWNGASWTRRATSGPSAREGQALAFDSGRGVTVLFGGFLGDGVLSDETWEWDGSVWTQRVTTSAPTPRYGHAMCYDSARGTVLLFGGQDGSLDSETWEWDGRTGRWTLRASTGPTARTRHALAYDSARNVTVLFGGQDAGGENGARDAETWEWDGQRRRWTQIATSGPSPRSLHTMSYDSARGVVVLFGGFGSTVEGDTWEWDGATWTERTAPEPAPRAAHGQAFDSLRGVTLLFGGFDGGLEHDTWQWDGTEWTELPTVESFPQSGPVHVLGFGLGRTQQGMRELSFELEVDESGSRAVWSER